MSWAHCLREGPGNGECGCDEFGQLGRGHAAGFVFDVGQPLCGEIHGIKHVEVNVEPPERNFFERWVTASPATEDGSAATSLTVRSRPPRSRKVPTLNCRRHSPLRRASICQRVALAEHCGRVVLKRGQPLAQWALQQLTGKSEL